MEREKNNTGLVVVVTILAMLVLGLTGFIIYDKVINKANEPNSDENNDIGNDDLNNGNISEEVKAVELNSELVTSLKYPKFGHTNFNMGGDREYKNANLSDMTREELMVLAAYDAKEKKYSDEEAKGYPDYCLDGCAVYSAKSIESSFKMLFGPDVEYYNGKVSTSACREIEDYDEDKKLYFASYACGGDSGSSTKYFSKKYKAEQSDNYLYVYEYVQKVFYDGQLDVYELIDKDGKTTLTAKNIKDSEIYKLMDEGKTDAYKWTFKKQSDGKYYFYSGAWEN